jgi:hypothetical protein
MWGQYHYIGKQVHMKRWLIRAFIVAAVMEVAYLGVVNLALNLPLTQTLINRTRPEKFAVYWDHAWTLYPFRLHARGISANGQTSSQQWQADAPAASGSISILPLLNRDVYISNVTIRDIVYYQRPRPRPDKDFSTLREFFPEIRDRELEDSPPPPAPKKKRKPWSIHIADAHVRGSHRIWIYQAQCRFRGELHSDMAFQTQGGPLSLVNGGGDLELESLVVNRDQRVAGQGSVKGSVEMAPFVPRENKGVKALAFLKAALDIDIETDNLEFLNLYLGGLHGMVVDGAGKLEGHIAVEKGKLRAGTDLKVSARELTMTLLSHRVEGEGSVHLDVKPGPPESVRVAIEFGNLQGFQAGNRAPLLTGNGLSVTAKGTRTFVSPDKDALTATYLGIDIPSARVPDLSLYQRYLPPKLGLKLHGGQGELQGKAELANKGFNIDIKLVSQDTDLGIKAYRFHTNLEVAVRAECPLIGTSGVDIAGTYLVLDETELSQRQEKSTPWYASVTVEKGVLKRDMPEGIAQETGMKQRLSALKRQERASIWDIGGEIELKGRISDLRWLNLLMKNPYAMSINGEGEVTAVINIAAGWLAPGTNLLVLPKQLTVNVLDYVIAGDGRVEMEVLKGGENPDISLQVDLDNGLLKRHGEKKAFVEDVNIDLDALGRGMSYNGPGDGMTLNMQLLSATVTDMSVYNRYLPPQSPFVISGGKADLTADINLKPSSALGFVMLKTTGMQSFIDDQKISGELAADIKLAGGVPKNMEFDIAGSSLVMDKVRIDGERKTFDQEDWHLRLDLDKGRAVWRKPTLVEMEADLQISDTRPLVAIISNQKDTPKWLNRLLTIEDIRGNARMTLAQDRIIIPYAFAGSEKVDVGAKGTIDAQARDGVFYVRFKKLHALLKIKDEKRNLHLIRARQKFDSYSPSKGTLR